MQIYEIQQRLAQPIVNIMNSTGEINELCYRAAEIGNLNCPLVEAPYIPDFNTACTLSDEDKEALNRIICSDETVVNHFDITIHISQN